MFEFFDTVLDAIGSLYKYGNPFYSFVLTALTYLTFHNTIYLIIGIFFTRKFKPAKNYHKYAILIPARNERTVLGNLLESIKCQDYPAEHLTVFVIADNCTDDTALVARNNGAICYERHNTIDKTKGFALKFLFEQIDRDYGIDSFEGFFIFDADNLLNNDFISRMNDSFDSGCKIVTSYRNTKNFDENWIASTYALHWLRSIRFYHRARSVLRLATNIQGTGFLFASELVKDGWNYTSLTEDRAFTADAVAKGYQISYNDEAMFFDEQPISLRVALRQRIRWAKGHLLAFAETGPALFANIFTGTRKKYRTKTNDKWYKKLLEEIRSRWASFDCFMLVTPKPVIKAFVWIVVAVIMQACFCYTDGIDKVLFRGNNGLSTVLQSIFGKVPFTYSPGFEAFFAMILLALVWNIIGKFNYHIKSMLSAVYVFIAERKKIIKIPFYKKILYTITWPVFDIIGRWSMYFALFMKVEWKPIPHASRVTIHDIDHNIEHNISHHIVDDEPVCPENNEDKQEILK